MRICIYGGTDLQGAPTDFITKLAYEILDSMQEAVIVTGGFLYSNEKPDAVSTDVAALRGARRYTEKHKIELTSCYEAWIPEPRLDMRPDVNGVVRMSESDGIALRVMKGRTPLGRRLAMVADVDVVVTISGKQHTEIVVEQALDLGLPVFPIPNAGGDSEDLLLKYRERIAAGFDPGALDDCLVKISKTIDRDPKSAAEAVVELIQTAKVGKCLILSPFDVEHDERYKSVIEPAVAKHMFPVRLNHLPSSEAIYTSFADAIQSSSAVIIDITTLNENVMYEIGYSHGRGLTPLIYTRDEARLNNLPVYLRTLNIRLATDAMSIRELIEGYLRSVKASRNPHQGYT